MKEDELLACFHRYRRACQVDPMADWSEDTLKQWEGDRLFVSQEYFANRHIGFGYASDQAMEHLFIRCCGNLLEE